MKRILCLLLALITLCTAAVFFVSCDSADAAATIENWQKTYTAGSFGIKNKTNPFAEITVKGYGTIRLELYPDMAPLSVANFTSLAKKGFYDGVVFHRINNTVIQAGGFTMNSGRITSKTSPNGNIKGEFSANGYTKNTLSHLAGVLSMARSSDYNSGSSQFFICAKDYTSWDGQYAAFGKVIDKESLAVVKKIDSVKTGSGTLFYGSSATPADEVPFNPPVISKITIVQIR